MRSVSTPMQETVGVDSSVALTAESGARFLTALREALGHAAERGAARRPEPEAPKPAAVAAPAEQRGLF